MTYPLSKPSRNPAFETFLRENAKEIQSNLRVFAPHEAAKLSKLSSVKNKMHAPSQNAASRTPHTPTPASSIMAFIPALPSSTPSSVPQLKGRASTSHSRSNSSTFDNALLYDVSPSSTRPSSPNLYVSPPVSRPQSPVAPSQPLAPAKAPAKKVDLQDLIDDNLSSSSPSNSTDKPLKKEKSTDETRPKSPEPPTVFQTLSQVPNFAPVTNVIPAPEPVVKKFEKETGLQFVLTDAESTKEALVAKGYKEDRMKVLQLQGPKDFAPSLQDALLQEKNGFAAGTLKDGAEVLIIDPTTHPKFASWWPLVPKPKEICQSVVDNALIKGLVVITLPPVRKPQDSSAVTSDFEKEKSQPPVHLIHREPTSEIDLKAMGFELSTTRIVAATKGAEFEESLRLALRSAKGEQYVIINPFASIKFSSWWSEKTVGETLQKVLSSEKIDGLKGIAVFVPPSRKPKKDQIKAIAAHLPGAKVWMKA